MNRRELLRKAGWGTMALAAFSPPWAAAAPQKKRILYFTRSAGYMHSVVDRRGMHLSFSENMLSEMGKKAGLEVVCTQDGAVFDGDLSTFDGLVFYASGNLLEKPLKPQEGKPMSANGKQRLLDAIRAGKGFVGIHAATDPFRREDANDTTIDPYTAMIGAEFIEHEAQQKAKMKVVSPTFPGMAGLGDSFVMYEEWYAFRKFAPDLHVILMQETAGMHGALYQVPPFPATWARMHGRGRVFYTSMGHREDVWTSPTFQQVLMGGILWALRNAGHDVTKHPSPN